MGVLRRRQALASLLVTLSTLSACGTQESRRTRHCPRSPSMLTAAFSTSTSRACCGKRSVETTGTATLRRAGHKPSREGWTAWTRTPPCSPARRSPSVSCSAPHRTQPICAVNPTLVTAVTSAASSIPDELSCAMRAHVEIREDAGAVARAPSVEPSGMAHRRMVVNRLLATLVVPPLLAACSSVHATHSTADDPGASLSRDEVAKAVTIARGVIADQGATVTSASVVARPGSVKDSNTGHPCTSGRELQIRLIGKFPHTVTTGHPVEPGVPTPDFTVRAMNVTGDAESGLACLIGVQTDEKGRVKPLPGSTMLSVQAE